MLSNQDAVTHIHQGIDDGKSLDVREGGGVGREIERARSGLMVNAPPQECAKSLVMFALERKTKDNVTALVVSLDARTPVKTSGGGFCCIG